MNSIGSLAARRTGPRDPEWGPDGPSREGRRERGRRFLADPERAPKVASMTTEPHRAFAADLALTG